MPKTYTVTYSDVEQKAMEYVATDVDFWIQNAAHERARIAQEEMLADYIQQKLNAGEPIEGTREELIAKCDLPNAVARNEAALKQMLTNMPPVETDEPAAKPAPN